MPNVRNNQNEFKSKYLNISLTILLIDNEKIVVALTQKFLNHFPDVKFRSFLVKHVGELAWQKETIDEVLKARSDLILMDYEMPDANGDKRTSEIRRYENEHKLPHHYIVTYSSLNVKSNSDDDSDDSEAKKDFKIEGTDDAAFKTLGLPDFEKVLDNYFEAHPEKKIDVMIEPEGSDHKNSNSPSFFHSERSLKRALSEEYKDEDPNQDGSNKHKKI